MPLSGPIARGTLRTIPEFVVRLIAQAGTLLLVAHMLGPEQFGTFSALAALAILLGALATFGTQLILFRAVARDISARENVLSYAVPTTVICGTVLLAVYLVSVKLLLAAPSYTLRIALALGTAELLLQPFIHLVCSEHHARGNLGRSQSLTTLPLVLRLIVAGSVALAPINDPLQVFAWAYLAATAGALLVALCYRAAPWPPLSRWRLPRSSEIRDAAGFAAVGTTNKGLSELDKALAAKLLPLDGAGVYAAGTRVIGALVLPLVAMVLSALPRLARDRDGTTVGNRKLHRALFGIALVYGLLAAVGVWVGAPVIARVFGPDYEGLEGILVWQALALTGIPLRIAGGNVLVARGYAWTRTAIETLGLTLLVGAAIALVPSMGTLGLPCALTCSEWCMAAGSWVAITFQERNRYDSTGRYAVLRR